MMDIRVVMINHRDDHRDNIEDNRFSFFLATVT